MARIFIVEDDLTVAAMLRHSIASQDHEIMHFTNAEDCIGNMGLRPDIVSIDYNLLSVGRAFSCKMISLAKDSSFL
ncbi:MAG: hypothetical protein ACKPB3_03330 [Bacteroidota bacterium]